MVKKSQRMWIIFVGLFISLLAAFAVPKTEKRAAHAADTFNGSDANPIISSKADLSSFASYVNDGNDMQGKTVTLAADIELEDVWGGSWSKIGDPSKPFKGTFDGQNHTISNVAIFTYANSDCQGFFGCVDSGGTIRNLNLQDVGIFSNDGFTTTTYTSDNVGGICGLLKDGGKIEYCTVSGSTTDSNRNCIYGRYCVGGICGKNEGGGTIRGCHNKSINISSDGQYFGGIVGETSGSIFDCSNAGTISTNSTGGDAYAGGICGNTTTGSTITIGRCSNVGDVSVPTRDTAGGIVGATSVTTGIGACYNRGTISGASAIGGILGWGRGYSNTIYFCYNSSTITRTGANAGNIGGSVSGTNLTQPCYYDSSINNTSLNSDGRYGSNGVSGTAATASQFASGEIAYHLNGDQNYATYGWYQSIDNNLSPHDDFPVLDSSRGVVYRGYWCKSSTVSYSNYQLHSSPNVDHPGYNNGFCTKCGKYQACSGSGTSASPYLIDNAGKLYWFSAVVNNDLDKCAVSPGSRNVSACGKLTGNVDLDLTSLSIPNKPTSWSPIGRYASGDAGNGYPSSYRGKFDGDNYTISNMSISGAGVKYRGLFGQVYYTTTDQCEIKNVKLKDANVTCGDYSGLICGYSTGANITNCHTIKSDGGTCRIEGNSSYIGGICGYSQLLTNGGVTTGHVTGCSNAATVTSSKIYVGGIAGATSGNITSCSNTANVTSSSTDGNVYAGGIVGYLSAPVTVSKCYNTGNISSSANKDTVGGIVGCIKSESAGSVITNCYNTGTISANSAFGGILGWETGSSGTVSNCYNAGVINGSGTNNYGAIIGSCSRDHITFENCYNLPLEYDTGYNYNGTSKTAAEFASGEVAWLLNGSTSTGDLAWYQSVDNGLSPHDSYPVFDSARGTVYKGYVSCIEQDYSNTELPTTDGPHDFTSQSNGFCTRCGKYQACSGSGTSASPYLIDNAGKLYWFSAVVNNNLDKCATPPGSRNVSACGKLTGNVDLDLTSLSIPNKPTSWSPIGRYASGDAENNRYPNSYRGKFDGDNYTISNMSISDAGTEYRGLFGQVYYTTTDQCEIKNVKLKDANVTCGNYGGLICGYSTGANITNCHTIKSDGGTCRIEGNASYIGGICGYSELLTNGGVTTGHVTGCSNAAEVTSSNQYVGGITGATSGNITSCSNTAAVTSSSEYVGGIAGATSGNITSCSNTANITSSSTDGDVYVGGIVGNLSSLVTVSKCYNTGDISSSANKDTVGGIVGCRGTANAVITNCYNQGAISGASAIGGILGWGNNTAGTVSNCYNSGAISGGNGSNYNYSAISGSDSKGTVSNCYNTDNFTKNGNSSKSGTPKTAAEFASGEVAWLLNGSTSTGDLAWYQSVDNGLSPHDSYPVFDSARGIVYKGYVSCTEQGYSNTELPDSVSHSFEYTNGICANCGVYQAPAVGDGTAQDPYLIDNAGKLYWFACVVNGDTSNCASSPTANAAACGTLTEDIYLDFGDLSSLSAEFKPSWSPIGNNTTPYTGTFDGDECTIHNLIINASGTAYQGLFGKSSGTIQNITLEDANITGGGYTGAVCGYVGAGTVSNCRTVKSENGTCFVTGGNSTSGIVGYTLANITSCRNEATVTSSSGYVGGICGLLGSGANITNCANTGQVGNGPNCGGIVGTIGSSSIISKCWNSGLIDSNDNNGGGIAGLSSAGTIINCYNTGTVGRAGGTPKLTGGILGSTANGNPSVINCYNAGVIYHTTNWGHIIGGGTGGAVENCYYNREVLAAVGNKLNGTAKTAAEFASGEVAWRLNGSLTSAQIESSDTLAWKQNVVSSEAGIDAYPIFDNHAKVYPGYECGDNDAGNPTHFKNFSAYDGTEGIYPVATSHDFEGANGFCTRCGAYQEPTVGDGTAQDPYLIDNAGKLYWFACVVNGDTSKCEGSPTGNAAACGTLTGNVDLDLTSLSVPDKPTSWSPIGNNTTPYTGTFDGGGHTVSGMNVNITSASSAVDAGFFGFTSGATIQNTGIINSGVTVNVSSAISAGGFIGQASNNTTINNCYSAATVTTTASGANNYSGGFAGYINSSAVVTNSYATGNVTGSGSDYTRFSGFVGVLGDNYSKINNCYATGNVEGQRTSAGTGNVCLGGIVGYQQGSTEISNCYAICDLTVTAGSNQNIGRIRGINTGTASISNCYSLSSSSINGTSGGNKIGSGYNGTQKTAAEFANFNVKDLLQTYVTNNPTVTLNGTPITLNSWAQEESYPTFSAGKEFKARIDWGLLVFKYENGTWTTAEINQDIITFTNTSTGAKLRYQLSFEELASEEIDEEHDSAEVKKQKEFTNDLNGSGVFNSSAFNYGDNVPTQSHDSMNMVNTEGMSVSTDSYSASLNVSSDFTKAPSAFEIFNTSNESNSLTIGQILMTIKP